MSTIFSYSWSINEEEENITEIRIWGLNQKNESVCLKIQDFQPYVYLELPHHIDWKNNTFLINEVRQKIIECCGTSNEPIQVQLVYRKKLFYANIEKNNEYKWFPFLKCWFATTKQIKTINYKMNKFINIVGIGSFKCKIHESNANPILQLTCNQNIPTAGWIKYKVKKESNDNKDTYCDHEYVVEYKNLKRDKNIETSPKPLIMSFDIEVNSSNINMFPKATKPHDKIFQISCIFNR